MENPRLFTTSEEIKKIKDNLEKYSWYKEAYIKIKLQVDALFEQDIFVPDQSGYVFYDCCKRDNQTLIFDPFRPYLLYCPECGMRYSDEPHKRAWIVKYHSFLSQMSVLIGIVYQIEEDEKYAKLLHKILMNYVGVYPSYLNNDNELGPTKMAQSTYMESVFIMNFAAGYDMVITNPVFTEDNKKSIENIFFRESVNAIIDYDEGKNNRQAFNNTGILAVGFLFNDNGLIDYALNGKNGFISHMKNSVLSDGFWYEGDNYHFATVPSLVNIAEMCIRNGIDVYKENYEGHTIEELFLAPLKSIYPDLTLPSRKDSRYNNQFAQRWYTGLYELAYRRYKNPAISSILKKAYNKNDVDIKNSASAAGIMDIFPSEIANRSNLDWRGFLTVEPELDINDKEFSGSYLLEGTGLAVIKQDDGTYLSLDYGDYGGGHGHPDRLNINYFSKGKRWFSDFGTGNYYFDHLRWYRSSVGHNVINVDGMEHMKKNGECTHFCISQNISMVRGTVENIAPNVNMERTLFLIDNVLVDFYSASSVEEHRYHYVLHPFGNVTHNYKTEITELTGDNYEFLKDIKKIDIDSSISITYVDGSETLGILSDDDNYNCYTAKAYGPPTEIPNLFSVFIAEKHGGNCDFAFAFESFNKNDSTVKSFKKNNESWILDLDSASYEFKKIETGFIVVKTTSASDIKETYVFDEDKTHVENAIYIRNIANKQQTLEVEPLITNFLKRDGSLCVAIKNNYSYGLDFRVNNTTKHIISGNSEEFIISNNDMVINDSKVFVDYSINWADKTIKKRFEKSLIKIARIEKSFPIDDFEFKPNAIINSENQIRRAEKLYEGLEDLSAEFMVCDNGECLIIRGKIIDNNVLFYGGKFPYDNDSIQFYLDFREISNYDEYINPKGVFGFIIKPPVFAEATKIEPVGAAVTNTDMLTASIEETENGYDILLAVSWEAIGGKPKTDSYVGFDIIVNDRDSGSRRDLQGVWSGCLPNERIYLRQDKHQNERFGVLKI